MIIFPAERNRLSARKQFFAGVHAVPDQMAEMAA